MPPHPDGDPIREYMREQQKKSAAARWSKLNPAARSEHMKAIRAKTQSQQNWETVDWSRSNLQLSQELRCSISSVWHQRKKRAPHTLKHPPDSDASFIPPPADGR